MANNRSAIKRIKVNERNRLENRVYKGRVKNILKNYFGLLKIFDASKTLVNKIRVSQNLQFAYSLIDKAVKKKDFHINKASRKKSQLIASLKVLK